MNETEFNEIDHLLHRISAAETHNQHEKWIAQHANLAGDPRKHHLTHNDLDILDVLLTGQRTVSEVVAAIEISQGGTSRRINHLARLNLLEKFHQQPNKKTVYLRLTAQGESLAKAHLELHQRLRQQALSALTEFTDGDAQIIKHFLTSLIQARREF
ncbi:MarR family winged helix-turn-helix transcriptional regulator [Pediococcus siamensis]|uniref:MarR family winged helix-turn-helix transcriptional regulator n=1 Tax=Pediococcus siamensis TaxID=381829 RepID=UPI0039A37A11